MHSFFGSEDRMMQEDYHAEIKEVFTISFDNGKDLQIPAKLLVEDRVVVLEKEGQLLKATEAEGGEASNVAASKKRAWLRIYGCLENG